MKNLLIAVIAASSLCVSACASSYTVAPVAHEGQTIRYLRGQPSVFHEQEIGAIQVTPLGLNEKGRAVFAVAAFNDGGEPVNFGVENIDFAAGGADVRIFTYDELEKMAQTDAAIAMVIVALAGAATVAAANSGPTSTTTTYTPHGTYYSETTNYALQSLTTSVAVAQTTNAMSDVANGLDATLVELGDSVLQTTTIDPGSSFGGLVITDRITIPDDGALPAALTVEFNGETYAFDFSITKDQ